MLPPGLTPLELAFALLVTFLTAALQGTIGFGFATVAVPILSLVDPSLTPIPQLLLAFPLTVSVLVRERGEVDLAGVGWIVAGRVPGAFIGAQILATASRRAIDLMISVFVMVALAITSNGWKVPLTRINRFVAGVFSGIAGTTSAIGGPPLAILYRDRRGPELRATLAAIFTIGILINVAVLAWRGLIDRTDLQVAALLLPALVAGFASSSWLTKRVEGRALRIAVGVVAGGAAVALAARSLFG